MSLLDGGIRSIFGAAFSGIMLPGTLSKITLVDNGLGGWTETVAAYPIRGQVDACTEAMRGEAGYTETDMKLIVIQAGVAVAPNTDDRITLAGRLWSVASVRQDPAASHWIMRGHLLGDA